DYHCYSYTTGSTYIF
nr:immunoglobulin light chain junction region [Macaca mulatta]